MKYGFHDNATALIVAAAKQSGLLDEVAEALCFLDKDPTQSDCGACELLSDLADAFDEHAGFATSTLSQFYGPCWGGPPRYSEEELRPYFHVPFEVHTATMPPRFSIDFGKLYDAEKVKAVLEVEWVEFRRWAEANCSNAPSA